MKSLTQILGLLVLAILNSCSARPQSDGQVPNSGAIWLNEYKSLADNLSDLKRLDKTSKPGDTQAQIEITNTLNGLFANLKNAHPDERQELQTYLKDRKQSKSWDEAQPETNTNPNRFETTLGARQSLRVPVKTYCLNLQRHGPTRVVRYKISDIAREVPLRQLVFAYHTSHPESTLGYQSILWAIETQTSLVSSIAGLDEILKSYNVAYDAKDTVQVVNEKDAVKELGTRVSAAAQVDVKNLEISLISGSYKRGDLIIYNTSDKPIKVNEKTFQVRFIPEHEVKTSFSDTINYLSADRESDEKELMPDIQNILVNGIDPSRIEARTNATANMLDKAVSTADAVDKSLLPAHEKSVLQTLFDLSMEFYSQGESEEASRMLDHVGAWAKENALDLATAFTPGLNDLRDGYEAVTGKDLISGAELTWWQRGFSVAGLVISSGAEMRKGLDCVLRSSKNEARVAPEVADKIESLARGTESSQELRKKIEAGARPSDFHVRPNGEVIPANGHRYVDSDASYLEEMVHNGEIPASGNPTYISFDKYDKMDVAQSKLQLPNGSTGARNDARYRVDFDTAPILDDVRVPQGKWGTSDYLEPITNTFPEFGVGGATQAVTNKPIPISKITDLKDGKIVFQRK